MSASAADIARLRRMTATTGEDYPDDELATAIERYPIQDADYHDPDDTAWVATYDLNAAAADIWEEKAAARVAAFDFGADGANFSRSQAYQQAAKMAAYYRSRRVVRGIDVRPGGRVASRALTVDTSNASADAQDEDD